MSASSASQSPRRHRRFRTRGTPDDDRTTSKRPMSRSIGLLAIALISVWLLQSLVAPLLPRSAEIPYSEFKARLAAGQISDVTLGTPIEGAMVRPGASAPEQTR